VAMRCAGMGALAFEGATTQARKVRLGA